MIVRLTEKLGEKIGIKPKTAAALHDNHFADWTGHLFLANRLQLIIFTDTATLYSLLIPGKGIKTGELLLKNACAMMAEIMNADGLQHGYENHIQPCLDEVIYAKTLNRSVTGSMNDLIYQSKMYLAHFDLSLFEIISRLNDNPLSYLDYNNPRNAMRQLMQQMDDDCSK